MTIDLGKVYDVRAIQINFADDKAECPVHTPDRGQRYIGEAAGYNILWGHAANQLYHSCILYGKEKRIGALVRGQRCYVRVDAFNENGITKGIVKQVI